ncbi:helix-turn-helix domain-containing protein [Photobacterium piscicola]|uniref:helix-turn-helix domain-containing protein n=1 Tax=Photobacterium piscicola TaxID=1378299 RepID=UPI00278C8A34|nr:winged helix-turn-helix domain-containing protein [Photobacterium piscicola]
MAKYLKVSRTSVNKSISVFLEEGLAGLQEKPRSGRTAFITPKQREQLSNYIKLKAQDSSGRRLIEADIHAYILNEFDKNYHPDSIYHLLKRMGFSWITSRSKQSQQAQDNFKKFKIETILKIPGHIGLDKVDV